MTKRKTVLKKWGQLPVLLRVGVIGTAFAFLWRANGVSWTTSIAVGAFLGAAPIVVGALLRAAKQSSVPSAGEVDPSEWISVEEIAQRLSVPEDWVWRMAARGEIPHVKTERGLRGIFVTSRRFRRADFEDWMRESEKGASPT
jgi:excisionase family DNA binding protein